MTVGLSMARAAVAGPPLQGQRNQQNGRTACTPIMHKARAQAPLHTVLRASSLSSP
jgi:hypothetical protein